MKVSPFLTRITDAAGSTTTYEYATVASCASCGGSVSSPSKVTDPLGNQTKFGFDKNGRISSVIDPLSHLSAIVYDAGGRVSTRMDANGKLTKYSYDALGRVTKQTDANDGVISFAYDSRSNLLTVTDPNGNTTSFAYDLADRMIRETRPMGQATEYAYYPNGLLKTVKDARGQTTTYAYDKANRLATKTYQDGTQDAFTYDAVGNIITYSNLAVSGSFKYDALNRKTSETINYGSFTKEYSYTYDGKGNKSSYTSPEGAVYSYAYNRVNQLTGIAFNGKTITYGYEYDRLVSATLPNGITTDYQYNANSWLTYITAKNASSIVSDNQYSFDNAGNITGKTTEHGDYAYSYDSTYQLTNATSPAHNESFTYDKTGNRLSYTLDLTATTYAHNANNELTSADTISYQYDNNGNTISETKNGQTTVYGYNSANRLETVTLPDGRTATYTYDPFGRRIKKTIVPPPPAGGGVGEGVVTYYAYSDEGLIGEYDSNGNIKKAYGWRPDSIWGTGPVFMIEGGSYYFYHNDTLGTPQRLTDESGNTVWSATYTAFGEATVDQSSTIINNLRFPGQYYDEETGLHYNDARYYNPKTGRYTQTDPYGLLADVNPYRYGWNSPSMVIDPHGEIGLIGVGIGAAIGGISGYYYTGTWQGAVGGAFIGGTAGFFGQFGSSWGAGILIGTLVGGGENLAWQMFIEGKSASCLDWNEVGYSAILGGATGGIGWKYFVKALRSEYVKRVQALAAKVPTLRKDGYNDELIARILHAERREIAREFKERTPREVRKQLYERNTERYKDPLGPTIEYFIERGVSWKKIIESASRTGGKDLGL